MQYRRLGKSGIRVSELSFGAWVTFGNQIEVTQAVDMMKTAYDAGVNFFDNAEIYGRGKAELVMGEALKKLGWRRDSFLISSKVLWGSIRNPKPTQYGLHRKHVFEACDQALERLGVEYLDLYLCHRPDPQVPMEEIVRAMTDLIHMGKVFYWGTSEWSAQQIMEAHSVARQYNLIPATLEQPEYNMFQRRRIEVEYARLYETIGLGTTTWSPLASGILTGKYNAGIPRDTRVNLKGYGWLKEFFESEEGKWRIEKASELSKVAEDLGTSLAKLSLAWCLKNPNVSTVITGASRVEQVEENMGALEIVPQLTDDVMQAIEKILDNKPEGMEFQ
ncbi:MAG: aldo/keto reductase [Chloroflexi bacterium]|nr:aldo/keto reductase [Chloroflexota bacterium]